MRKLRKWTVLFALAVLLGAGALTVKGVSETQNNHDGYMCPVNGEQLPCPACCELNR